MNNNFFTIEYCILKCNEVLDLKINEISKISGIPKYKLELKIPNDKNEIELLKKIFLFISKVESVYGTSLKKYTRNVLINKKTLIYQINQNKDNLEKIMPLLKELSDKSKNLKIIKKPMNYQKLQKRLGNIGKMA